MEPNKRDFIFQWDLWILLLITYSATEASLHIIPNYQPGGLLYCLADAIVVASFIADIIVRYRLTGDNRKQYFKGWFIVDLLPAIPFELLLPATGGGIILALRLIRLVKALRVYSFKPVWEYHINLNPGMVRLGFFFYYLFICMHVISCGWVRLHGQQAGATLLHEYIKAFYWCTATITTVGFGDFHPDQSSDRELLYTTFVMFLGVGAYGYTIGNIATVLTNIDISRTRHRERVDKIANFMKSKKIPKHLQERIHHYYRYLWESRRGHDDAAIMDDLPPSFRYEVASILNQEILKKVPILKGAEPGLLRELSIHLRPCIYPPGDAICNFGEVGDKMFFINRGAVEVMSRDGKDVYATLKEGDFFGEMALLLKQPRNATIRAVGYCDLYSLSKESFDSVLSNYPDFEHNIQRMAGERTNKGDRI